MKASRSWKSRRLAYCVLAFLAVSGALAYSLALIIDRPRWLRGIAWVWRRFVPTPTVLSAALLLIVLITWVLVLALTLRSKGDWSNTKTALLLFWTIVFTPIFQLAVTFQHRDQPLSASFQTTTEATSGFFEVGVKIDDPVQFMKRHVDQMPGYRGVHVRTQPPGIPMAFWLSKKLWDGVPSLAEPVARWLHRFDCNNYDLASLSWAQIAAATLQMSLLFVSGFGAVPLLLLGRRLEMMRASRLALVLYPLMPALLVFQARLDVLYAVLALTVLWLVERIIVDDDWRDSFVLAALLVIWTLFGTISLAMIALANVFLIIRLLCSAKGRADRFSRVIRLNLLLLTLLAIVWGGIYLLWGISWPEILIRGREIHQALRISNPSWPIFNLYELAVFMGIPVMVGVLGKCLHALRQISSDQMSKSDSWTIAWVAFLVLLMLSGEVRAETGRLWIFMMLPGLLVGSSFWYSEDSTERRWRSSRLLIFVVMLTFAAQGLTTGSYLGGRPTRSNAPEAQWSVPQSAERTTFQLGDHITLQGFEVRRETTSIRVTLYWQARGWTQGDYSVFVHLLEEGQLVAQSDGAPAQGLLPTLCWVPGELVTDPHQLEYALEAGKAYDIGVGLYQWQTGQRAEVVPAVSDDIILLPVELRAP